MYNVHFSTIVGQYHHVNILKEIQLINRIPIDIEKEKTDLAY